jgi:hypothetical protein
MRLSEWRTKPPTKDAGGPKIAGVVDPVLMALGAGPDPHCWIAWGDEPSTKFTIFVPTEPGLIACFVRVNVPGDGPRASTKLIRWNRVSIGELGVETQAGHRMLSFQLESQILRGADAEADRAAAFALRVIAAIDGRPLPPEAETRGRRAGSGKAIPAGRTARVAASGAGAKAPSRAAKAPPTKPASALVVRAKAPSNANR